MMVLGLDCSAAAASVAVVENGALIGERTQPARGEPGMALSTANYSTALLQLIESVLRECGLSFGDVAVVGIAIGPGSFTGLRVGLSTAKGLVYGSSVPLFGVRTLEAMARCAPSSEREPFVCPFLDARKGQVYAALYYRSREQCAAVMADTLDFPDRLLERVRLLAKGQCVFLGEAAHVYRDLIEQTLGERARLLATEACTSTAAAVARIAEERSRRTAPEPLATLVPDYVRPPDAVPPKPKV